MLTRPRVTGFENLVDVDVRPGPFTCVAGPDGEGKSNRFDAIGFPSALAESPFFDAAQSIRNGRTLDLTNLAENSRSVSSAKHMAAAHDKRIEIAVSA